MVQPLPLVNFLLRKEICLYVKHFDITPLCPLSTPLCQTAHMPTRPTRGIGVWDILSPVLTRESPAFKFKSVDLGIYANDAIMSWTMKNSWDSHKSESWKAWLIAKKVDCFLKDVQKWSLIRFFWKSYLLLGSMRLACNYNLFLSFLENVIVSLWSNLYHWWISC